MHENKYWRRISPVTCSILAFWAWWQDFNVFKLQGWGQLSTQVLPQLHSNSNVLKSTPCLLRWVIGTWCSSGNCHVCMHADSMSKDCRRQTSRWVLARSQERLANQIGRSHLDLMGRSQCLCPSQSILPMLLRPLLDISKSQFWAYRHFWKYHMHLTNQATREEDGGVMSCMSIASATRHAFLERIVNHIASLTWCSAAGRCLLRLTAALFAMLAKTSSVSSSEESDDAPDIPFYWVETMPQLLHLRLRRMLARSRFRMNQTRSLRNASKTHIGFLRASW